MRVASLDLGSNTFLLLVVELNRGQITKVLADEVRITRLGQGVDQNKYLHSEALQRAEQCFIEYSKIIKLHNVDKVVAMSTSAARDASNKADFFALGSKYGIPIEIITGDKEAELTYLGSTFDFETGQAFGVIDIGGGSTEIIGQLGDKVSGFSFDVGSVRLTERFIYSHPVKDFEIQKMKNFIAQEFEQKKHLLPKKIYPLIAVAGTPTTLACIIDALDFSEQRVHKKIIAKSEVKMWRDKLAQMSLSEREQVAGLEAKRADVIVAGLTILETFLDKLELESFVVSTKGVRYGVALSL